MTIPSPSSLALIAAGFVVGVVVLATGGVMIWIVAADRAVLILTNLLSIFGGASRMVRRRIVKSRVQSQLNLGRNELNQISPRTLPSQAELKWTTPENVDSYLHQGKVIVRMSYYDHPYKNLVVASMLYVNKGMLPTSKAYLRRPYQKAIDLLAVEEMLQRSKQDEALHYFRQDVLARDLEGDDTLNAAYDQLAELSDTGYVGRILVPELLEYPLKVKGTAPRGYHKDETTELICYLHRLCQTVYLEAFVQATPDRARLDFASQHVRLSFVIVGKSEKLHYLGHAPYLDRIRKCRQNGATIVYLLGSGRAAHEVRPIAEKSLETGCAVEISTRMSTIARSNLHIDYGFARLVLAPMDVASVQTTPVPEAEPVTNGR